jgi:intermediate cleaving peptidase 55
VFYEYVQDRDFSYLTGWAEPESLAVVVREDGEDDAVDYKFWLFVREKDRKAELWDGARSGVDAAREVWNADEVSGWEDVL